MPWLWFALVLAATWVVQTSLLEHVWPAVDLFVVLALILGFSAPTYDARIAAWICGFAQDLGSESQLGIHAVALGLTGLVVTQLREQIFRQVFVTRLVTGLLAAIPGQIVIEAYRWLIQKAPTGTIGSVVVSVLMVSVVSAVLAATCLQLPVWLGRSNRYRYSPRR